MFDIHQKVHNRHDELDERLVGKYIDGLMEEFAAAPEAQPIIEQEGDIGYAGMMLEYYFNHIGDLFAEMSVSDFNEVVFELFPRKVSIEPERAPAIIAELKAFWAFVQRQYGLESATAILKTLDDRAAGRLQRELADPSKYGMAKSFVMGGIQAGFDMTRKEDVDAYAALYNANLMANPELAPLDGGDEADELFLEPGLLPLPEPDREKKRKERKRQRQARKRNRRR
ncbi:MAG: hypothetical protein L0Z62_46935 [Gemmataceae bacterium]|nr:hypothetical protein [Gemmataceae bacterium]